MAHRNLSLEFDHHGEAFEVDAGDRELIDLDRIAAVIRRQWKVVLAVTFAGTAVGLVYLWFATPLYSTGTNVLIDQGDAGLTAQVTGITDTSQADAAIMSQVELLGSQPVAAAAVDALHLDQNKAFLATPPSLHSRINSTIKWLFSPFVHKAPAKPATAADGQPDNPARDRAIGIVMANTSVERVRGTFLLNVSYTSPDPQLATAVANALADGYLSQQLDSKYEATRKASDWLEQRIKTLSQESLEADEAVQNYRSTHNLQAANGQLLSDQQLAQLNTNLVTAQNATTAAKAKLDQINSILATNDPNALVTTALDSPLINDLRQHYLDAAKREAEFESMVGPDHFQVDKLKAEMAEYQKQIRQELGRIASSYKSDYDIAVAHQQSAQKQLDDAAKGSPATNATLAKLNELEMKSQSVKGLYQAFLQNYQAAAQRTSFPIAQARIVAPAEVPTSPSSPVALLALAASTFLGGLVGIGVGGVREFRDRFVRTVDHLRNEAGLVFLGMVPLLEGKPEKPEALPAPGAERQQQQGASGLYGYAITHTHSQFAETLRSTKVAVDLALPGDRARVIGMVSLLPGEGKTTMCSNLASQLAATGARTLVIDADLRRPMLSHAIAPRCKVGLVEVLLGSARLADAIFTDAETGLDVLPVSLATTAFSPPHLLGSPGFAGLLDEARRRYDYVVLDLPPVAPVVDALAVSPHVDAFVLVVQWGTTSRQFLQATLAAEPRIAEKCVGAILNRADIKKLQLYRTPGSTEAYLAGYSAYYRESG